MKMLRHFDPQYILASWQDTYEWDRFNIINKEVQHYAEKNALNSGVSPTDVLGLTAIAGAVKGAFYNNDGDQWGAQQYSSAMFISQGTDFVETGQYVEAELKLPHQKGCFPAFWLLREDPTWAKTEIDIVEGVGKVNDGEYHIAFHSHTAEGGTYQKLGEGINTGADLTGEYNKFGAFIGEDRIDYYFNREKVGSTDLHDHEKGLKYYMLLNLAIAGDNTWASNYESGPYGWNKAHLFCKAIKIFEGVPTLDAETVEPAVYKEYEAPTTAEPVATGVPTAQIDATIAARYRNSTTIAKVLYDLARKFGGKI